MQLKASGTNSAALVPVGLQIARKRMFAVIAILTVVCATFANVASGRTSACSASFVKIQGMSALTSFRVITWRSNRSCEVKRDIQIGE